MKLENIGAIKQFILPDKWSEQRAGAGLGVRWEKIFAPDDWQGVEIIVSYRGVPLDEASRKVLSFLMKQGERDELTAEEILALRTAMGVATIGDNQYTNPHPPESIDGPVFNLESIGVKPIAARMVLYVEGRLRNRRRHAGITYQAGSEGKIVEELFLQVPDDEAWLKYRPMFDVVLQSIVWR
ncbi:MAG: hypothetical protein K2X93_15530 [Candidatus Obscuribacterales bacterium]|nr:hypothetical protein [Candidatus Obscuribacterales bacterium]